MFIFDIFTKGTDCGYLKKASKIELHVTDQVYKNWNRILKCKSYCNISIVMILFEDDIRDIENNSNITETYLNIISGL